MQLKCPAVEVKLQDKNLLVWKCCKAGLCKMCTEQWNHSECSCAVSKSCWFVNVFQTAVIICMMNPAISWIYLNIIPPPTLNKVVSVPLSLDAMAIKTVWWMSLKRWRKYTFLFNQTLSNSLNFYFKQNVRVEQEVLCPSEFVKRWVTVANMFRWMSPL